MNFFKKVKTFFKYATILPRYNLEPPREGIHSFFRSVSSVFGRISPLPGMYAGGYFGFFILAPIIKAALIAIGVGVVAGTVLSTIVGFGIVVLGLLLPPAITLALSIAIET